MCSLLLAGLNVKAQSPEAGEKYRISNGSGLYLTCDPEYNEGYNPWFIDSLYTVESTITVEYTLNEEAISHDISTDTTKQVFTLVNPDPNDPEIWAIEASNGEYMAQSTSYAWDVVLSPSPDISESQFYFLDQGYSIFLIQVLTRSGSEQYLATDNAFEGESIGTYDDGWEYLYRPYVFNDKPATQPNDQSFWILEKIGGGGGSIPDGIENNSLSSTLKIYPTVADETLKVIDEYGTKIMVYSITGIKVIDTELKGNDLNISSLHSGVYIITTSTGKNARFFKK